MWEISSTFAEMNKLTSQPRKDVAPTTEADIFREKAENYLVCFNSQCPQCESCLRYLVGKYASERPLAMVSVNPRHPKVATSECPVFRNKEQVMMKRGLIHFYDDMPSRKEYLVRHSLIAAFGRKNYFEMRKGVRLISPEEQDCIADTCRQLGWTGELHYDGEQMGYDW